MTLKPEVVTTRLIEKVIKIPVNYSYISQVTEQFCIMTDA